MDVWWIVALSVALVLVSILVFRLHAFLTLLLAGLLVAALTSTASLQDFANAEVSRDNLSSTQAEKFVTSSAPARLTTAFGETVGKIGILIAMASIIGQCLLESGAARQIVDRMLKVVGPRRAPEALAASAFVLSIPVFFDTVFYLMIPLARSLRERVGKDYVLFILAIFAGGSLAHSLIPPTPGPLLVAKEFNVDLGVMLLAGFAIGGCGSIVALLTARLINRFVDVPLRSGADSESAEPESMIDDSTPRPSLIESLIPILIPVVLITVASMLSYAIKSGSIEANTLTRAFGLLGDKNIAISLGVVFALTLTRYCQTEKRKSLVTRSLASAGNIILITAAGGAFGAMLRQAGIAGAVTEMVKDVPAIWLLPVAFAVTAAIRTVQGSATVAMITSAGVLIGLADAQGLPFHRVYLCMAIGAGSKPISWMTDSGFWIMTRMSGMTETEGLKTIPLMSTVMGIAALIFTMIFATLVPGVAPQ
ncbi:GntP family permease [Planctomycetes bacterium K23_9]|uniref:Inner membrane permease YgbN n=1 Tax=Stieleria marina TaxID=1930275 RepID=A0A517NX26_9BACT|nr:Inner membrane permease YgbN [Planctomycetes bacterium K23_9]